MPGYWFLLDSKVVRGDDFTITMTFSDTAGAAVDISSWTFAYEANERSSGAATITVADGAMTKSNSGSGVVDTVAIPLSDTDTNKTEGRYDQDVKVTLATGEKTTIARGTLTIYDSEQD